MATLEVAAEFEAAMRRRVTYLQNVTYGDEVEKDREAHARFIADHERRDAERAAEAARETRSSACAVQITTSGEERPD
jgi:hypothetical protein